AAYKKGTDLVLLAFLITAALVEYLADSFLRFWQRLATDLPQDANERLMVSLGKRHWKSMLVIFAAFVVIALSAWFAFSRSNSPVAAPRLLQTAVLGGLGYLMLSMALLEIIILASVNAISMASLAVALGVAVNLLIDMLSAICGECNMPPSGCSLGPLWFYGQPTQRLDVSCNTQIIITRFHEPFLMPVLDALKAFWILGV